MTGKVDPGEPLDACASREALEETGLRGKLVDLGFAHRYRGRKGEFEEGAFLLKVARDAAPTLSDEHVRYRWASPDDARSAVAWDAHRRALELAIAAF